MTAICAAARATLVAVLLCTALTAAAQAQDAAGPLALDAVHEAAVASSLDVSTRHADLAAARRHLDRAQRDPLATGLERLQAEHAVAAAEEAVVLAEAATRIMALQRHVAVLEAQDAVAAADGAAEIAERQLAADRVRFEAGVITALDLQRTEAEHESMLRALRDARSALDLAWSELSITLARPGQELRGAGLAPLPTTLPELPNLDTVLALDGSHHATLAAADRAAELAAVRLAGSDHEGTAPNDLAALRDDLATAERRRDDAYATALLQLRSSHQSALAAYDRFGEALAAEANAETTFIAQQVRAEAGEVSALAVRQAELDRERAAANRRTALHAAHLAWVRLEQVRLGG